MKLLKTVVYILLGLLLAAFNIKSAVMYFSILPIQAAFLSYHYQKGNFVLTVFFFITFLSMGISPIFFFLTSKDAHQWGYDAVGYYDFSLLGYYWAYLKVLFYFLIIHFLSIIYTRNRVDIFKFLNSTLLKYTKLKTSYHYSLILIIAVVVFSLISIWMFNNSIGITGVRPKQLPFHLSGILFYLRGNFFGILLFYLYLKSTNKNISFLFVSIFAIIGGFTACSKGLAPIVLGPIIYESYLTKHNKRAIIGIVLVVVLYGLIAISREMVFMFDQVEDSLQAVIEFSTNSVKNMESSWYVSIMGSVFSRLYGANTIVLADQYNLTSFGDIISYYLGSPIESIIPNYTETIFGINMPEDRSFGVAIGYLGTMMLLSSGHYLYILIQAVFVFILFNMVEKKLKKIVLTNTTITACICVLIATFMVYKLIEGTTMISVYGCALFVFIFPSLDRVLIPLFRNRNKQIV